MNINKDKCLVVYFSREGNNYVNGKIENLSVGNTEVVAKMIQNLINSDIFKVETVNLYPYDYNAITDVAKKELKNTARPELTERVINIDSYDVIFLGYPNWWGTMPMAMFTFLEEYDFSGKIIIPFCTHEGSGMGRSETDIKILCPNSDVLKGLPIKGSNVHNAEKEVAKWLYKSGLVS